MSKFHILTIKDIRKETGDTVSIALGITDALKESFSYKPGQYITLKLNAGGEEIRRSYSLSSSPDADSDFRIAVKMVPNGKASTLLNQKVKVGETIEVMPPQGNFTPSLSGVSAYVFFAAGSGITPVISIVKSILKKNQGRCVLFYGNKDENSVIFKKEIDALATASNGQLQVVYIYSRQKCADVVCEGRIDKNKAKTLLDKHVDVTENNEYFMCGPEEMIKNVSSLLENIRVPKANIHFELFTTPTSAPANQGSQSVFKGKSKVTIIMDGEESHFDLSGEGDSILNASMKAGVDAPFSCKGAVCCTCKAKVLEGHAMMKMNYALTDKEVQDGFILTCQAHPTTEKLVVDYDVV